MGTRDSRRLVATAAQARKPPPVPEPVRLALESRRLTSAYLARPALQRRGYLGWIARARRDETRAQRLQQMLDELQRGDCYLGMAWQPRRPIA